MLEISIWCIGHPGMLLINALTSCRNTSNSCFYVCGTVRKKG